MVDAAKFAIEELQQLSDSGVDKSLFLNKIKKQKIKYVYHYNIFLTLNYQDYFDSGKSLKRLILLF